MDSSNSRLSGQEIIREDLRQMCIYKQSYQSSRYARAIFWEYIKNIHSECGSRLNEDCSKFAHKETRIDWEKTEKCVSESFSSNNWQEFDTTNKMIDENIEYWKEFGSGLFPSVVINNITYRG